MDFSPTQRQSLSIEASNVEGYIQTSQLSSFQISGSCKGFNSVMVTVSSQSQTLFCVNSRYTTTFDLTAESDGVLEFKATAEANAQTIESRLSLTKDIIAPVGAISVTGLGSSPSSVITPRSVTFSSTGDYYFIKLKRINSGTCAAADFSSSPTVYFQSTQSMSILANQPNTLCVIGADRSGNWQASVYSSAELIIDTTAPVLTFNLTRVDVTTNTGFQIDWTLTEKNPDSSQDMTLEFSPTGSAPWTPLNQVTVGPGAVSNQSYSYMWTSPGTQTNAGKLRLKLRDLASLESTVEIPVAVDDGIPVLDSIILADSVPLIAIPSVKVQTSATTSLSPISHIKISEDPALTGAPWINYNSGINFFDLTRTSGLKTVYAQVRSGSGQTSNILSSTVTLEFGTAPVVKVTSPIAGTSYAPGVTLNIDWTCSTASSAGLAPVPINFIKYSVDDGISYHDIASNLTNNLTATTGSYAWVVPAITPSGQVVTTSTPIRLTVNCSSAAGIVASGMSELLNSEWRVLAGEPGNIYENLHISAADITSNSGFFGDSTNALFYPKGDAIMRMNPKTGMVQKWAGEIFSKGCTLAADGSGLTTTPRIIDITNDKILFQSVTCGTLYLMDIATKTLIWSRTLANTSGGIFYTKSGHLFYHENFSIYSLDINSVASTPELVVGTPGVCGTPSSVGSPANASPIYCAGTSFEIAVSPDRQKIWIFTPSDSNIYITKADSSSPYLITTSPFASRLSRCVETSFDTTKIFCSSSVPVGTGIGVRAIDLLTNTLTASHTIPVFKGVTANQARIGAGRNSFYATFTTNELFEVKYESSTFTSQLIGGGSFHVYGNGSDPSAVAFTKIAGMSYNDATKWLYVRGIQHLRRLHINTTDPLNKHVDSIETGFNSNSVPNSGAVYSFAVNVAGNRSSVTGSSTSGFYWRTVDLSTWDALNASLGNPIGFYYTGLISGAYPTFNQTFGSTNVSATLRQDSMQHTTFLPNGNFYFVGSSDRNQLQDLWIWESTGSAIKMTAGASGASGFEPSSDNTTAVGARLGAIHGLQPDTSGDLLIFDGDHLRKVTVATEPGAPKIYNLTDFSALSGYPGSKIWDHAKHDNTTGWSYFAKAASQDGLQPAEVWAVRPGDGWVEIPVTGILLPYYATKSLVIEITPLGLLILDPTKSRILQTDLKAL